MVVQNAFSNDSRVLRIAGSIAARGADVTVLALEAPDLPAREDVAGFHVKRMHVAARALRGRIAMPVKIGQYIAQLFVECLRSGAGVYHVHDPLPLAPAVAASWLTGAKVIYDVHELHFGQAGLSRAQAAAIRLFEGMMVRGVDRVIMSDGASRAALFRKAHRYTGPMDYIYNCPLPVDYPHSRKDLRAALGIPAETQLVVFSGSIGRGRPLDRVVSGIPRWPQSAHFAMVGQAPAHRREPLELLAAKLGVADRVHFFGPVPPHDVVPWLMSADVAVTTIENVGTSYFNSAPTKMFEAIMARVPQVASDFPEIRRVVRETPPGPVGELVDPANANDITDAIVRMLADPARRESYRENADKHAREHFNWRIEETKLHSAYDAVAGISLN